MTVCWRLCIPLRIAIRASTHTIHGLYYHDVVLWVYKTQVHRHMTDNMQMTHKPYRMRKVSWWFIHNPRKLRKRLGYTVLLTHDSLLLWRDKTNVSDVIRHR